LQKLAEAIGKSGQSRYQISKATDVDPAVLCRIVNGGSCGIETADKLCAYLGLELAPKKNKKKAR